PPVDRVREARRARLRLSCPPPATTPGHRPDRSRQRPRLGSIACSRAERASRCTCAHWLEGLSLAIRYGRTWWPPVGGHWSHVSGRPVLGESCDRCERPCGKREEIHRRPGGRCGRSWRGRRTPRCKRRG